MSFRYIWDCQLGMDAVINDTHFRCWQCIWSKVEELVKYQEM